MIQRFLASSGLFGCFSSERNK